MFAAESWTFMHDPPIVWPWLQKARPAAYLGLAIPGLACGESLMPPLIASLLYLLTFFFFAAAA